MWGTFADSSICCCIWCRKTHYTKYNNWCHWYVWCHYSVDFLKVTLINPSSLVKSDPLGWDPALARSSVQCPGLKLQYCTSTQTIRGHCTIRGHWDWGLLCQTLFTDCSHILGQPRDLRTCCSSKEVTWPRSFLLSFFNHYSSHGHKSGLPTTVLARSAPLDGWIYLWQEKCM